MKTLKLFAGLLILMGLAACEKDEMESLELVPSNTADIKAVKNFNNGMINSYSNIVVLEWNEFLSKSIDASMPQPTEAKIYAMVTLAMHDALNNVVPKFETYALDNSEVDASSISKKNIHSIADAAVAQAARDMIVHLFPLVTTGADELLNARLSEIEDSVFKIRGIEIGKSAASAVLEKRAGDFPLRFVSYLEGSAPGEYQANYPPYNVARPPIFPDNAVFAPNLGELMPFGILSGDQFRDEAPHPLNSGEYLADYNEVKSLGCVECPLRTEDQTEIGFFWIESNASSMNRLARQLITEKKLDGWEAARLVALVEMAVMDAYIASFEGKAYFNFWRPITAIRAGDFDGVDGTIGDPTWMSNAFTAPTAEFPSTHAYNGAAAAAVFRSYFKNDHTNIFVTSPYNLPGVERHLSSFSQLAYENAISRIYIGYHFRQAVEVGKRQGTALGEYVFNNNLRELKKLL
ncbi:vanadium-dependent haloperoxidase [Salinimicrobium oceani]|uniref:Vanadium-dependent haloperoxidase n=1 Tax=Salinimicrobium oceani TaxID=2722702 RepID=A0ABX1CZG9_9FLAO|nr:vanadium-dependent haloperoxidase [Salinimicrobium oceani]NJW52314.1 vanadium-dependent haloperoxidase [Salinimicrobium oceani]